MMSSLHGTIGCTALGFYCLPCKAALKKENVRRHLHRYHKHLMENVTSGAFLSFLSLLTDSAAYLPVGESCLIGNTKIGFECSVCFCLFARQNNFRRHVERGCHRSTPIQVPYRDTVCGRHFIIREPPKPAVSPSLVDGRRDLPDLRVPPHSWTVESTCDIALATGSILDDVEVEEPNQVPVDVIGTYVREDESPKVWSVHFECLMKGGAESFAARMRQLISLWSVDVDDEKEPYLAAFIRLGNFWFHKYAYNHLKRIPANIRNKLIVFDAHEFGGSLYGGSFFLRKTEGRLEEENKCLISFCWRFQSIYLDDMKDWFKKLVDANKTLEEMVSHCVFQKFLLKVHFQEATSPRDLPPIGVQYCLSRCFKRIPLVVNSSGSGTLTMMECQAGGTRLSNTLHLLRAALLGVVFFWPREEEDSGSGGDSWIKHGMNLAERSRSCYFTNIISPIISDTRAMGASKPTQLTSSTDSEGNISIGQFVFHSSKWRALIPMVHQKALEIFDCILDGATWRDLSSLSSCASNASIDHTTPDIALCPRFSWHHGNDVVSSASVHIQEDTNDLQFNRLSALVQLIFHGLGTGAMRQSQTFSLQTYQVRFRSCTQCYYNSKSNKSYVGQHRCQSLENPLVLHKVPPSLVWIVLLYRLIVSKSGLHIGNRDMIQYKGSVSVLFSMTGMLSELFGLFKSPTALEMRHLWTSLSNIVDPNNGSGIVKISAGRLMAQKSHHSASTHSSIYATSLADGEEKLFEVYHAALGEPSLHVTTNANSDSSKLVSEETILRALKVLYGPTAQFLSQSQQDLVWYCINGLKTQHLHGSICCGGGKSLAWILPVVVKLMLRWRFGMTMVVVPYAFLERHHCHTAELLLKGKRADATTSSICLSELDMSCMPPCFMEHSRPHLLFLSVDAMNFLLQHHINYLRNMVENGNLETIFIDEVHTFWGEQSFRPAFDKISNLASLGCAVVTMTGSLPPNLVPVLSSCLGLTGDPLDASDMTIIPGDDPIGVGFRLTLERVTAEGTKKFAMMVGKACHRVQQFLQKFPEHSVHVIVATKLLGEKIFGELQKVFPDACAIVTSNVPRDSQQNIAEQWFSGRYRVLLSTTCALVGNECPRCRFILCVGNLYSACQLVQAIGRLRECQRGCEAEVRVIAGEATPDALLALNKASEELIKRLRGNKHLSTKEQETSLSNAFSFKALHNFLHGQKYKRSCLRVGLCMLMGYNRPNACKECSGCDCQNVGEEIKSINSSSTTAIQNLRRKSHARMDELNKAKTDSRNFFGRLDKKCLVCNQTYCDGVNQLVNGKELFCIGVQYKCFNCGVPQTQSHQSSQCKIRISLDKSRACYQCLDRYDRVGWHALSSCPLKRRLRTFLQSFCRQKHLDYAEFVERMHDSEQAFYNTVGCFEKATGESSYTLQSQNGSKRKLPPLSSNDWSTELGSTKRYSESNRW